MVTTVITALSIMTFGIKGTEHHDSQHNIKRTALRIMTLSTTKVNITTFSIMTFNIKAFSTTLEILYL
jgi:hypothetical protein